jgi:hypothetical protein
VSNRYASRLDTSRLPAFESFVAGLTADKLKVLARQLVGKDAYKMNRAACLAAILRALEDETTIGAMVRGLEPLERWGLGLVKLRGGQAASTEEIAAELLMFDSRPAGRRDRYGGADERYGKLNGFLGRGLLIRTDGSSSRLDHYYPCATVVADPRILAHAAVTPPMTLTIPTAAAAGPISVKRQSEMTLQMIALGEGLTRFGGLPLTAAGMRAKPAVAKLAKQLGEKLFRCDDRPTPLADPLGFFLSLFAAAGLFTRTDGKLTLNQRAWSSIVEMPVIAQASVWVPAYRGIGEWAEHIPGGVYFSDPTPSAASKFNGLRAALLVGLAALPDAHAWYRIADLSDAMYHRMGACFSLGFSRGSFYPPHNASPYEADQQRAAWEKEDLGKWRGCEQAWITHALAGPLYHLGLVELARKESRTDSLADRFRLSDAGRAGIYDVFRATPAKIRNGHAASQRVTEPCWIVQPNFDVVVYLDRAAADQLKFIERVAVRQHVGDAAATYRLSREATYEALESGLSVETVLHTLVAGSHHPLPEGVARSLTDWALRREKLAVHLSARLLEFDDVQARDAALAAGEVDGRSVGERFVLVERLRRTFVPARIVGYEPSAPRCLTVAETGDIDIDPAQRDILIQSELTEYCESDPQDALRWRVTRRSVRAAVHNGLTSRQVVERLSRRASHALPPIIVYAISAWAGGPAPGTLAIPTVEILQVEEAELADAIAKSRVLRRHLSARLGPAAFLVKSGCADQLRDKLVEFGLPPGQHVISQQRTRSSMSSTTGELLQAETAPEEAAPRSPDHALDGGIDL